MSNEVYVEIAKALETGEPVALATVASSRGSTPRKPGAKMLVPPRRHVDGHHRRGLW